MKSRKQRRLEARQNGVQFEPQYNGMSPVSYEEHYGVGYERFNNKFLTVKAVNGELVEMADETAKKSLWSRAKGLFKKGRR